MNKAFLIVLLILLGTNFISCGQSSHRYHWGHRIYPGNNIVQYIQDSTDKHFYKDPIDDTVNYKHVADNIYCDTANRIYILTVAFSEESDDTLCFVEYYSDLTYFFDLKTYRLLGGSYFVNKGKVYEWGGDSDGERPFEVRDADANTFVPFDSVEGGSDKNFIFYGGVQNDNKIIRGANPRSTRILKPAGNSFGPGSVYFIDGNTVYSASGKIEGADAATFKLVSEDSVDARDKYRKYSNGWVVK